MVPDESGLLLKALCYEAGHPRRTQHILKVYALAKLLGEREGVSQEEQQTLRAAAILHDIPIRLCKIRYHGDACQENQQKEAPGLVASFLQEAGYPSDSIEKVLQLVLRHHDYTGPHSKLLQLLIEADLLVNCYENPPEEEKRKNLESLFVTETGKLLFQAYAQFSPK